MKKIIITLLLVLVGMAAQAQPFDPFGTYRLMDVIDKNGDTIPTPFDQYKICMKDVTLTFVMEGNHFIIRKTDKNVLKYTGEEPDAHDATATRIYGDGKEKFTLKWWSTTPNHKIFPHNDWCIEHYALYNSSDNARPVLYQLNRTPASEIIDTWFADKKIQKAYDKAIKNPLLGRWRVLGTIDELRNVKQELKRLHEHPEKSHYCILTLNNLIDVTSNGGGIYLAERNGKKSFITGETQKTEHKVTWLSKDIIAIEINADNRTDYLIWERLDGEHSIFQLLSDLYK